MDHLRLALREGPCLVHYHRIDVSGGFESQGVLEEDASGRPQAGPNHDCSRRRQAQGIWAGYDHNRDGKQNRGLNRCPGRQPDTERAGTPDQCHQHEPECCAVGQLLARSLRVLGLLHQLHNLRQRSVGADALGPRTKGTVLVDRRSDQLGARALGDWQALPRHHRLVDLALAFLDHRVGRDFRAWPDEQKVSDHHLPRRDLQWLAVTDDGRARGRQVEQSSDRVVGSAARAHFDPVTEQYKGSEDCGRFVEHITTAADGDHQRVEPTGTYANRDEHHHVEGFVAKRSNCAVEKDPRRVEDDRQTEDQLKDIVAETEWRRKLETKHLASNLRPQQDRH